MMLHPTFLSCCLLIAHLCCINAFERNTKFEGQNCRTKQSEPGICKSINECHDYIGELKIAYGPIECFNNVIHCNFSNKGPVICCKRYDMVGRTIDTIEEPISIKSKSVIACESFKKIRNNFQNTKQLLQFHVIGGKDAVIREFPHMVAIAYKTESISDGITNATIFLCSGSLISDKFVLTALHCLNKKNSLPQFVRLGKTSLDGEDDLVGVDVNVILNANKLHQNYSSKTKHNDIALLELERSVGEYFSPNLLPACLNLDTVPIDELVVTGWGVSTIGEGRQNLTNWLQKANMTEVSNDECQRKYDSISQVEVIESQLCASSPLQADSCSGDSGGPLQYRLNDTFYITGVVSFGLGCSSSLPGIYARVSSYIGWIENIVWPQ